MAWFHRLNLYFILIKFKFLGFFFNSIISKAWCTDWQIIYVESGRQKNSRRQENKNNI